MTSSLFVPRESEVITHLSAQLLLADLVDPSRPAQRRTGTDEANEVFKERATAACRLRRRRPNCRSRSQLPGIQPASQPASQASQRLAAALPLAAPPELRLFPSWWPRLPFLPFRITVTTLSQP